RRGPVLALVLAGRLLRRADPQHLAALRGRSGGADPLGRAPQRRARPPTADGGGGPVLPPRSRDPHGDRGGAGGVWRPPHRNLAAAGGPRPQAGPVPVETPPR